MYGSGITVKNRCKQVAQDFQKGILDRTCRPNFELQTVLPSCFLCKHVTTLFLNTFLFVFLPSCLSACLPSCLLICLPHNLPASFINMPANLFARWSTCLLYFLSAYLLADMHSLHTTLMRTCVHDYLLTYLSTCFHMYLFAYLSGCIFSSLLIYLPALYLPAYQLACLSDCALIVLPVYLLPSLY